MFLKNSRYREISGILLIVLSFLVFLSLVSFNYDDRGAMDSAMPLKNIIGPFGVWISSLLRSAFGYSSFIAPLIMAYSGYSLIKKNISDRSIERIQALSILFISSSLLLSLLFGPSTPEYSGGFIGLYISSFLTKFVGSAGTWLIALLLNVIGFILLGIVSFSSLIEFTTGKGKNMSSLLKTWFSKKKVPMEDEQVPYNQISDVRNKPLSSLPEDKKQPWITREKVYIYPDGTKRYESYDNIPEGFAENPSFFSGSGESYGHEHPSYEEGMKTEVFRNYPDPELREGDPFYDDYHHFTPNENSMKSHENEGENTEQLIDRETGNLFENVASPESEVELRKVDINHKHEIEEKDLDFKKEPLDENFQESEHLHNNQNEYIEDIDPDLQNKRVFDQNRITGIASHEIDGNPDNGVENQPVENISHGGMETPPVYEEEPEESLASPVDEKTIVESPLPSVSNDPEKTVAENQLQDVRKNLLTGAGYEKGPEDEKIRVFNKISINEDYIIPATHLDRSERADRNSWQEEIKKNSELLVKTLKDFGIPSRVVKVNRGPVVTLYEMQIAAGIRVNKISGLADDIAMALAASRVRVVAPIPGKSAIGVEIPNFAREQVTLGDVLNTTEYRNCDMVLKVALGKDILGHPVMLDMKKQPHLLIAGATGAGKSVCVNSLITSLVYRYDPNHVRFIMVDPKMVELQLYNGLPHMLTPVITEPDVAPLALKWAIYEMERRYRILSEYSTRDIDRYNGKVDKHGEEHMERLPYIVIIVDELADLMMVAPKEIETYIARIAQKARAVGIHLVLATQRPSVDIITGIIKANFPSRIAFQVAQKTDSRTILDQNGAEQLLGKGDMLYLPPTSSFPIRIQGAFISEDEVIKVVRTARKLGDPKYVDIEGAVAQQEFASDGYGEEDELFVEALKIIEETKKASASYLQRRLSIGYNRAARIIERMEEMGYVGPPQGSKPREVLV